MKDVTDTEDIAVDEGDGNQINDLADDEFGPDDEAEAEDDDSDLQPPSSSTKKKRMTRSKRPLSGAFSECSALLWKSPATLCHGGQGQCVYRPSHGA